MRPKPFDGLVATTRTVSAHGGVAGGQGFAERRQLA